MYTSGIHSLGIQNIVVTTGTGQTTFSTNGFYKRIMMAITPPSGTPTFLYYIQDTVTLAIIDSVVGATAPQTFVGTVPYVNPLTIFIYNASIDGTYQMVNYVEK